MTEPKLDAEGGRDLEALSDLQLRCLPAAREEEEVEEVSVLEEDWRREVPGELALVFIVS